MNLLVLNLLTLVVCFQFFVLIFALFRRAMDRSAFREPKAWYADEIQQAERIRQELEQVESWKRFQTESSDAIEKG